MLSVTYELVPETTTGRLAHYAESRGHVRIQVAEGHPAVELIPDLNQGMQEFLDSAEWYQLWRQDIIGRAGRDDLTLDVRFTPSDLEPGDYVRIEETRGFVLIHVERTATAVQFVDAINPAIVEFLSGGQWFQLFAGEIVDMASPGSMSSV